MTGKVLYKCTPFIIHAAVVWIVYINAFLLNLDSELYAVQGIFDLISQIMIRRFDNIVFSNKDVIMSEKYIIAMKNWKTSDFSFLLVKLLRCQIWTHSECPVPLSLQADHYEKT